MGGVTRLHSGVDLPISTVQYLSRSECAASAARDASGAEMFVKLEWPRAPEQGALEFEECWCPSPRL